MQIPQEKLRELIADEEKGYEEYKSLGLNKLAEDEVRHARFLRSLLG
jgi:hypothetical protein